MRTLKIRPSFNRRFARTLTLLGAMLPACTVGVNALTISTTSQALHPYPLRGDARCGHRSKYADKCGLANDHDLPALGTQRRRFAARSSGQMSVRW